MHSLTIIILTMLILFVAALVKATLGFGESLLAIPLLTLLLGIQVAAPLVSLIAASITLLLVLRNWQRIDLQGTGRLLFAAVLGIPVGVWGLTALPATWLTRGLGVLLIGVGLYHLIQPTLAPLRGTSWAYLFGFLAGVFGGAYNTGSPPVLIYGAMQRWPPEQFRGSLQGFFLPLSLMVILSHASAGLWTTQVLQFFTLSIPLVLLAFQLGDWLSQTVPTHLFKRLVYIILTIIGITLIGQN